MDETNISCKTKSTENQTHHASSCFLFCDFGVHSGLRNSEQNLLSLKELAGCMRKLRCFCGNNGSAVRAKHLTEAPCVCIWEHTREKWAPRGNTGRIVRQLIFLSGCSSCASSGPSCVNGGEKENGTRNSNSFSLTASRSLSNTDEELVEAFPFQSNNHAELRSHFTSDLPSSVSCHKTDALELQIRLGTLSFKESWPN